MISLKKIVILFIFFAILLLLRDTPYLNVFIIEKLWVVYLLLLLWIFSNFFPQNTNIFFYVVFILLFVALLLNFTNILILQEIVGIIIYAILWLIIFREVKSLLLNRKRNPQ